MKFLSASTLVRENVFHLHGKVGKRPTGHTRTQCVSGHIVISAVGILTMDEHRLLDQIDHPVLGHSSSGVEVRFYVPVFLLRRFGDLDHEQGARRVTIMVVTRLYHGDIRLRFRIV
jgi:hypothetical protein